MLAGHHRVISLVKRSMQLDSEKLVLSFPQVCILLACCADLYHSSRVTVLGLQHDSYSGAFSRYTDKQSK